MTDTTQRSFRRTIAARPPGSALMRVAALAVIATFGFFLQFNVITVTLIGPPFLRLTDGLLFVFTPFLLLYTGLGPTIRQGLPYFIVLFAAVFLTLMLKTAVEQGDVYMTLIFLLTGVFCFYFATLAASDETYIFYFCIGTLIGLAASLLVLFAQASGMPGLVGMGLGVPLEEISFRAARIAKIKLGGLWGNGNEAGHVYAVASGCALYLALRYRRFVIYLITYGLLAVAFTFTLNRGGMIAPTIALIYCYIRLSSHMSFIRMALFTGPIAICAIFIMSSSQMPAVDPFGDAIAKRFVDDDYAVTNLTERLQSNFEGLRIAFENPFGIGTQERFATMVLRTHGVESIHNGFLSLAYQSGLLVSIAFVIAGLYLLFHRKEMSGFYTIMLLFTGSSMLFEELSINPFFIFMVGLIIAAAWVHYATSSGWLLHGRRRGRLRTKLPHTPPIQPSHSIRN